MKIWQIEVPGGLIVAVPACDTKTANIAVMYADPYRRYKRDGQAQYTVTIPGLEREWRPKKPFEMTAELYDGVLAQNKPAVLALIERLNKHG